MEGFSIHLNFSLVLFSFQSPSTFSRLNFQQSKVTQGRRKLCTLSSCRSSTPAVPSFPLLTVPSFPDGPRFIKGQQQFMFLQQAGGWGQPSIHIKGSFGMLVISCMPYMMSVLPMVYVYICVHEPPHRCGKDSYINLAKSCSAPKSPLPVSRIILLPCRNEDCFSRPSAAVCLCCGGGEGKERNWAAPGSSRQPAATR